MLGASGGRQIHDMMAHGEKSGGGSLFATIASIVGLILGATGAFMNLQNALNRAWEVKPDPAKGGIRAFISKRVLSGGMVLGIGFLLAVSLSASAALSALGSSVGGGLSEPVMHAIQFVVDLVVLSLLFAAMFRLLPDAKVLWHDVWVGGAATGLLFVLGKFAIGIYLGRSSPGDAFGAASALAVVLVWVYYAGLIVLFGAEFTQQWAKQRGSGLEPKKDAVRVIEHEQLVRPGESARGGSGGGASDGPESRQGGAAGARPPSTGRGGGIGDWVLGLPVLILIFRGGREKRR
jgi:membrane protein